MRATSRRSPRNSPRRSPITLRTYNERKSTKAVITSPKASPKSNDMSLRDKFLNDLTLTNADKTITDWRLDNALQEVEFHIMFLKNNEKEPIVHKFVDNIFKHYKAYLNSLNEHDKEAFINKKMNYILSDLKLTLESNFNEDLTPSFPASPSPASSLGVDYSELFAPSSRLSRTPTPSSTPIFALPPQSPTPPPSRTPLLPPPPSDVTTDEKRLIELYDKFNYVNILPDLQFFGFFDSKVNANAAKVGVLNFLKNDKTNDYNVNLELKKCYNDWGPSARKNPKAFTMLVYNCLNKFEPINNRLLPGVSSKLVLRRTPVNQNVKIPNVKISNVKISNVPLQHEENSPISKRPLLNVGQMPLTIKKRHNFFNVSKKNSPKPKHESRMGQMMSNTGKVVKNILKFPRAIRNGLSNMSKKANRYPDLQQYEERTKYGGGRRNTQKMRKNK